MSWTPIVRLRYGGFAGGLMASGALTWQVKPAASDFLITDVWAIYAIVALVGAFYGASAVLAARHFLRSPLLFLPTLAVLVLLSLPWTRYYIRETRAAIHFMETADVAQGVVRNKFVRGGVRLGVDYQVSGRTYLHIAPGNDDNDRYRRGDRVWVYFEPTNPENAAVRYPGPDLRSLLIALGWLWCIAGVVLTAYLPLLPGLLRALANDLRPRAAEPSAEPDFAG